MNSELEWKQVQTVKVCFKYANINLTIFNYHYLGGKRTTLKQSMWQDIFPGTKQVLGPSCRSSITITSIFSVLRCIFTYMYLKFCQEYNIIISFHYHQYHCHHHIGSPTCHGRAVSKYREARVSVIRLQATSGKALIMNTTASAAWGSVNDNYDDNDWMPD
jgi:hypothetical protein